MKKFVCSTILVFAVAVILVACGSVSTANGGEEDACAKEFNEKAPKWTRQGMPDSICAIGRATQNKNIAFSQDLSADMGRNEINKNVKREFGDLLDNYRKDMQIGDGSDYESSATYITEALSHGVLRMSEQRDQWTSTACGQKTVYTLMCLNPEKFMKLAKDVIEADKTLSADQKAGLQERADKAIERLESKITIGEKDKESQVINIDSGRKE